MRKLKEEVYVMHDNKVCRCMIVSVIENLSVGLKCSSFNDVYHEYNLGNWLSGKRIKSNVSELYLFDTKEDLLKHLGGNSL